MGLIELCLFAASTVLSSSSGDRILVYLVRMEGGYCCGDVKSGENSGTDGGSVWYGTTERAGE